MRIRILLHITLLVAGLMSQVCVVCAQTNVIDIKLLKSVSVGDYNGVNPILVCDLDDDGKPEMATVQSDYRDHEGRVVVIKGGAYGMQNVIGFGAKYGTAGASFGYSACPIAMTTVRDGAGKLHGHIYIVAGTAENKNLYLYKYNSIDDITQVRSVALQNNLYGIPHIADFNNDGRPEVFVGTEVFDAYSLAFIGFGGGDANQGRHLQHDGANFTYSTVYTERTSNGYDANNNTNSEKYLLSGNQLFTINPKAAPNGVTLYKTLGGTQKDGSALVADLDGDGVNEVIVRDTQKRLSIFSVKTGEALILNSPLPMSSFPAVGDIDGDGCDEIVGLKDKTYLSAYKLHPTKGVLYEFWTIKHSDVSAQTGITLYDFNGDGIKEIVYRDETLLRIINGKKEPYNLASIGLKSSTKSEKPIIADVLGSGSKQIIIGGVVYGDYKPNISQICIFGK